MTARLYGLCTYNLCHLSDLHVEQVKEVVNILSHLSKRIVSLFDLIGGFYDVNYSRLHANANMPNMLRICYDVTNCNS